MPCQQSGGRHMQPLRLAAAAKRRKGPDSELHFSASIHYPVSSTFSQRDLPCTSLYAVR